MNKEEVLSALRRAGVIPVVRTPTAAEALRVAEAVLAGGLPVLEITMTVPDAAATIARLVHQRAESAVVGAGSVIDAATAVACIDAGAQFIVSPVLDAGVVAACREREVAVIPGALTPTEILAAWNAGADLVKVFPVGAMGGASYLRSLRGPLPMVPLVATGGVTLESVTGLIKAGAAAVGAGSELFADGASEHIAQVARAYVDAVRMARR